MNLNGLHVILVHRMISWTPIIKAIPESYLMEFNNGYPYCTPYLAAATAIGSIKDSIHKIQKGYYLYYIRIFHFR